ncbi:unnamed protein product [Polarella glacialis]|uniref:Cellulase n=1 Tax=Polarella glacialis TaxID=89957 RepID=A0A813H5W0_POLGL|nr:unnamed protein product [Polarella glacialis]
MAAFAVLATAIRLGYVLAAASDEENCLLQAGAHKLTAHRGINIVAADRGEIQMADWLKKECYPGAEAGHLWHTWGDRVRPCVGQITDGEIQALEQSQHFCPHARGQESESAREQGGQNWCQRDGNLADQTCIYQANGIFDQKASEAAAPGLYAEYAEMRYGDPLYAYPPGSDLEKANAPRSPAFINVNQLYEDGQDKMIIWAGQCPLEGPELETNLPKEKHANVCSWLGFIKEKGVKLLISLAPNPAEIAESNSKPRCHDYVLDMTNKAFA